MQRLSPEQLPEKLNPDVIEILVAMAREFPQTKEWHKIAQLLEERGQLEIILSKVHEIDHKEYLKKEAAKTEEQRAEEARFLKEALNDPKPRFYGNMGEPERLNSIRVSMVFIRQDMMKLEKR